MKVDSKVCGIDDDIDMGALEATQLHLANRLLPTAT